MRGLARRTESRAFAFALLAAILLLAGALRLFRLGAESLWYDEAYSLRVARSESLGALVRTAAEGEHPPLYFLLLRGWLAVAAGSEAGLRMPSALFGIALVAAVYGLARALALPRGAALLAAGLTALHPHALWYAQEARMYTLASCLGALFLALAARLFSTPLASRDRWRPLLAGWAACGAALLATHYYALFYMGVALVWALATAARIRSASRRLGRRAPRGLAPSAPLRAVAAAALVWALAWALESRGMLQAAGGGAGTSWLAYRVSWATPWHILGDLATGQVFSAVPPWLRTAATLAGGALLAAGALLVRGRSRGALSARVPLAATLSVMGAAAVVSLWRPVLIGGERYPTLVAGPFCLAIAVGVGALWRRGGARRAAGLLALTLVVGVQAAYLGRYYRIRKKTMWREAVQLALGSAQAGDVLCPVPGSFWEPVDYYNVPRMPLCTIDDLLAGGKTRAWVLDSLPAIGAERRLLEAGWRPLQRVDVQADLPRTLVRVTLFAPPGEIRAVSRTP